MKRPGVITVEMLVGNAVNLNKNLLLYDELWVPNLQGFLQEPGDYANDEFYEEVLATLEWLALKGLLIEPPIDIFSEPQTIQSDDVVRALIELYNSANEALNKSYPTAERAAIETGTAFFTIDIALSRLIVYLLWRDQGEIAYPVVFPFVEEELEQPNQLKKTQEVLSLILKQFPDAPSDLPIEDLVSFKQDAETQYKFQKLWNWVRKITKEDQDRHELEEEIAWLLTDYRHHLKHLTKKIENQNFKVWLTMPLELIGDLVTFQWGKAAGRIFDLRRDNIAVYEDELRAPGNEIAYLKEAIDLLGAKARR